MAAELFVDHDNPAENESSDTKEDVKNVLFQLKSILNGTDPSITSESTVSEPTIPTKSSCEILSELFSAFNAEPPVIPENVEDISPQPSPADSLSGNDTLSDKTKVHRKSKSGKKHKHKHKHKHKKRVKQEEGDQLSSNSSSGITSPISLPSSKRIKLEKHTSALGLDVHSNITRDLGLPVRVKKEKDKSKHKTTKSRSKHSRATKGVGLSRSVKLKHLGPDLANDPNKTRPRPSLLGLSIKITNDLTYDQDRVIEFTPDAEIPPVRHDLHTEETNTLEPKSLDLEPPIGLDQADYDNIATKIKIEPGTESSENKELPPNNELCTSIGQAKNTGKISIKNLKFSSVFEATVREVEEQAKAKADQYEEGEISNSDCDDRLEFSPISSLESDEDRPVTSTNSFYNPIHKKLKKSKKRHHSEGEERSSKHHHLSKRRKDSANEIDRSFLDLSTSSQLLKYHDKKKKKIEKMSVSKKKHKQSKSPHRKEKPHKDRPSRSTSKSPKRKKSKTNEDKNATDKLSQPFKLCSSVEVKNRMIVSASGRKTVEELTNFCKRLSKKEQSRNKNGTMEDDDYGSDSDSEIEQPFNHPFQVKERPQSIVVNIRNSIQLPVKSLQEKAAEQSKQLCVQFPVSSGQRHRRAEDEWVPVTPKPDKRKKQVTVPAADKSPKPTPAVNSVSGVASEKDIGSIVTQKLRAMRTLQENPTDVEALGAMYRANQDMLHWAEAKQNQVPAAAGAPGLAVNPQTMRTLITPNTSCSGRVGMGMSLLQKMGWKPGEGLGKNREGALEPLKLEIKMDKKGLITAEDFKVPPQIPTRSANGPGGQPSVAQPNPVVQNVIQRPPPDKNPISKLVEFCGRRRWRGPQFELCHESGPAHRKNFLFKVLVNGTEYKPMVTSLSKKLAKAEAASICLQALRDLNQPFK